MERWLPFEKWKQLLRDDCVTHDKQMAFDCLGECVLKILYENGLNPTVRAIVSEGLNGKRLETRV